MVTPSHNPPSDGGFKYNPPDGGPAGTDITREIQDRANDLLASGLKAVRRDTVCRAVAADTTEKFDFLDRYVSALGQVVDLAAIRAAGVRIGADPLGGASVAYWGEIGGRYGLDLTVVNPAVDPTFRFMTLDWDGKIRMDCSSPYAMASLIARQHEFTIATGNDTLGPARHRHAGRGPARPQPLPRGRHRLPLPAPRRLRPWPPSEKPWSAPRYLPGDPGPGPQAARGPGRIQVVRTGTARRSVAFGGEESAGASFLQRDGSVWTTDKDGIILALLASEITAVTLALPDPV